MTPWKVATAFAGLMVVSGCQPIEDLFASDFKKFQRCVESTSKDGLISKGVAKQTCAAKYTTDKGDLKTKFAVARGGFNFCPDAPCGSFAVDAVNPSARTIITSVHLTVQLKSGKEIHGVSPALFVEPGAALSAFIPLSEPVGTQERADHKWFISGVAGIDIDG